MVCPWRRSNADADVAVLLEIDTEHVGNLRIVDVRIHADRVHDHVEGNRDRPLDERVLALDDQLLAVRGYLGNARLDVLDLELFLALPVVLGLVQAERADVHVVDVDVAVRQFLADLHRHVGRHRAADLRAPFAPDLAVARPDAQQDRDAFRFAAVGRAAHALPRRDHLLDLRRRHDVLEGAEAPLRLVDRIEVRESAAQDCGIGFERSHRWTASAVKLPGVPSNSRPVAPVITSTLSSPSTRVDHAADRVLRPFARRHELRVAGQDRRAAEPVFLLDDDAFLVHGRQTVRRGQTGRSAADDQDWFTHCSLRLFDVGL